MPIRRAATAPLAACAALAVLLTVSGCGLADRATRADDPSQEPTPTAGRSSAAPEQSEPSAAGRPELRTSTVTLDEVVLRVDSREAAVVAADVDVPGLRTVTLSLAPGGSADLTLTSPGTLDVDPDGSIAVLDDGGTPVAAIGPPAPPSDAEDDAPRIEVSDTDATHARVEVDDRVRSAQGSGSGGKAAPAGPVEVTFVVGTHAIESTTWGENEGGRSLAVDPTDWVRHAGEAGLDLIRAQLVAAEPEADSDTMEHQLVCHAVGAPDKNTWNLEPWRPDVGLILTAGAHCNPV
ncbi:DUF2599 domain-containing protein [Promicromonospora vindobonensis]|uniref:DUF2599 domain-containing protein n=1 Tax=Promicromonospora vindobonensis TaxID=195748 RepID=A0ABW5VRP9_9MICO